MRLLARRCPCFTRRRCHNRRTRTHPAAFCSPVPSSHSGRLYVAVRHEQCGRAGCQQIPSIDLHYPRMTSLLRAVGAINQVVPNSHVSVQMNIIRGHQLRRGSAPQAADKDDGCHECFHGVEAREHANGLEAEVKESRQWLPGRAMGCRVALPPIVLVEASWSYIDVAGGLARNRPLLAIRIKHSAWVVPVHSLAVSTPSASSATRPPVLSVPCPCARTGD